MAKHLTEVMTGLVHGNCMVLCLVLICAQMSALLLKSHSMCHLHFIFFTWFLFHNIYQ